MCMEPSVRLNNVQVGCSPACCFLTIDHVHVCSPARAHSGPPALGPGALLNGQPHSTVYDGIGSLEVTLPYPATAARWAACWPIKILLMPWEVHCWSAAVWQACASGHDK